MDVVMIIQQNIIFAWSRAVSTLSTDISCVLPFFSITTWRRFNNDLERHSCAQRHNRPTPSDSTNVSMGNNIFLQREVAVSDASPPFPGQPTYTPDNGFHHFSFEQQQKYKRSPDLFPPYASLRNGFMLPLAPMWY